MVLGQGAKLLLIGSVIGLGIGFLLSRITATLVVGVGPNDPGTFVVVSLVLLAIALLANFIPAHRATRIDPMEALRAE
jgi:ABC-type antimicrobial peptide transport system permease subunit